MKFGSRVVGLLLAGLLVFTQTACDPGVGNTSGSSGAPCGGAWTCEQLDRFDAVIRFIQDQPGQMGLVFRDRKTGGQWSTGDPYRLSWAASCTKLALAVDLLERGKSGGVTLSEKDKEQIGQMLNSSSDVAADALWKKYGDDATLTRWKERFGMSHATFVEGFAHEWGFVKASARDFAALMRYVLETADGGIRSQVVDEMRGVAKNQRWGVWAAGEQQEPGNKNGWSNEVDEGSRSWVTNTVGFAGPDQRYILAIMYQLQPEGTLQQGVHAVSDATAILFGQPTPAPISLPKAD